MPEHPNVPFQAERPPSATNVACMCPRESVERNFGLNLLANFELKVGRRSGHVESTWRGVGERARARREFLSCNYEGEWTVVKYFQPTISCVMYRYQKCLCCSKSFFYKRFFRWNYCCSASA